MNDIRYDWSREEIEELFYVPLLELIDRARQIHLRHHPSGDIQLASLVNIKEGGCPEDCHYCPQSSHYESGKKGLPMMDVDSVLSHARKMKSCGVSRLCMGAAWRQVKDGKQFDSVLEMVKGVRELGLEACVTLGMLTGEQAQRLALAGLSAYNHNLDTSPEFYGNIITTRCYEDRLETLRNVRQAGISVCCGGIIGMGESINDRAGLLEALSNMDPHPSSVPINALVAVKGTPLGEELGGNGDKSTVSGIDMVKMCAIARILMPSSRVRLSAGRDKLGVETQILCFLVGANSIFYGEKLLTTFNADEQSDRQLLDILGQI